MINTRLVKMMKMKWKLIGLAALALALPAATAVSMQRLGVWPKAAGKTVTLSVLPTGINLNTATAFSVQANSGMSGVAFVQVAISFDQTKVRLAAEATTNPAFPAVVLKTAMAEANASGKFSVALGLCDPLKNSCSPRPVGLGGQFEIAGLKLVPVAGASGGTTVGFDQANVQVVDLNGSVMTATYAGASLTVAGTGVSPTIVPTTTAGGGGAFGDANGDGKVDGADYSIWLANYGKTTANRASDGDFNNSGRVDGVDYVIWLNSFGKTKGGGTVTVTATLTPTPPVGGAYRAFIDSSYWNTPITASAPRDPNSDNIIAFLRRDNSYPFVRFSGAGGDGAWGRPIYWGKAGDPVYNTSCSGKTYGVHIPSGAKADPTSDAALTVYDLVTGMVFGLHGNPGSMTCSSAHVLGSNGLDRKWTQFPGYSADNVGHRGAPASNIGIRVDEIASGVIRHKLHLSINTSKDTHVFPMVGDENGTSDPSAPPEGALIRIKPTVNLSAISLSPAARIVATALQTYGAYVGEQSGGPINLKVENTVAEGRGDLWSGVLTWDALKNIPIEDYEVVQFGYGCGSAPVCSPVIQP